MAEAATALVRTRSSRRGSVDDGDPEELQPNAIEAERPGWWLRREWRKLRAARRSVEAEEREALWLLWVCVALAGGLILLTGTFLVMHLAARALRPPPPPIHGYTRGETFVYRSAFMELSADREARDVVLNVGRPVANTSVAVHQVRVYLVKRDADHALPFEVVYRHQTLLLAVATDSGTDNGTRRTERVLAAFGAECAYDAMRLPMGSYIRSDANEEWQVRCKLFNQWGQLTHAPVYYAVVVNITYHVLDEALGEKMHEVEFYSLGWSHDSSTSTEGNSSNHYDLPAPNGQQTAEWDYDVAWHGPPRAQVVLAYGITQPGAQRSELYLASRLNSRSRSPSRGAAAAAEEAAATTSSNGGNVHGEHRLIVLRVSNTPSDLVAGVSRVYPPMRPPPSRRGHGPPGAGHEGDGGRGFGGLASGSVVVERGATLRLRTTFANQPLGRVAFGWLLYVVRLPAAGGNTSAA